MSTSVTLLIQNDVYFILDMHYFIFNLRNNKKVKNECALYPHIFVA